jgi:hypothetical protein
MKLSGGLTSAWPVLSIWWNLNILRDEAASDNGQTP